MAATPRPPRRPVVGSRNPTGRPRSVAGRRDPSSDVEPDATPTSAEPVETPTPVEPAETPRSALLTSRRTTVALVVALVLMAGAVATEAWYLWFKADPVVSVSRPVVTGQIAHRSAVESASQSIAEILSYGYQDFDAQIDEATARMTDPFAAEFRETAADVKDEFVAAKTEQDVRVVAASVVQASSEKVRALLFIDQYVVKGAAAGEGTSVTPYRALVTMVHTDSGWLVDDIETR